MRETVAADGVEPSEQAYETRVPTEERSAPCVLDVRATHSLTAHERSSDTFGMRARWFVCIGLGFVAGVCACVGDSTPVPDGGGNDATTGSDACAAISNQPGVDCFNGSRCTVETQTCCVGLTGQGIIGQCGAQGSCGAQPYQETWSCDKGFDCPPSATKCCAGPEATSTLFGGLNSGSCPFQLHVSVPADAGPDSAPPPFTIASCQTSCPQVQLCATDSECGDGGLRCVPVEFSQSSFSKTFGVCLP